MPAASAAVSMGRRCPKSASGSPGMNSRASAYWPGVCTTAMPGAYSSATRLARSSAWASVSPATAIRAQAWTRPANASGPVCDSSSIRRAACICRSRLSGAGWLCSTVMWWAWWRIRSIRWRISRATSSRRRTSAVITHSAGNSSRSVRCTHGLGPVSSWSVIPAAVSTATCTAAPSARVIRTVRPNGRALHRNADARSARSAELANAGAVAGSALVQVSAVSHVPGGQGRDPGGGGPSGDADYRQHPWHRAVQSPSLGHEGARRDAPDASARSRRYDRPFHRPGTAQTASRMVVRVVGPRPVVRSGLPVTSQCRQGLFWRPRRRSGCGCGSRAW